MKASFFFILDGMGIFNNHKFLYEQYYLIYVNR